MTVATATVDPWDDGGGGGGNSNYINEEVPRLENFFDPVLEKSKITVLHFRVNLTCSGKL